MLLRFLITLNVAGAFVLPRPVHVSSSGLGATAVDAISSLASSQAASIDSIAAAIPDLAAKPDFTWNSGDGITMEGCTTTLDARDAAGPANIAWLSSCAVESKISSLTIFNGPLSDVPHFVSRCAVVGDSLRFTLDFRPRGYGAYEMKRPDGSYPGPDELGRKSFEYSGARNDFDSKFGNDEVKSFISFTIASLEGAESYDATPAELDLLTRGPLYTCVTMPITDGNVAAVTAARETAANFWLSWATDNKHEHRPGAPVNTQYVYDTKYKQNAYGALLSEYSDLFGQDEGAKLAMGESGPLDEGYVGGGS
jgi:hypothetical protein